MRALAPREARLVALGLLALLLALVWLAVVRPIFAGFEAREEERQQLLLTWQRGERVIGAIRATRTALRAQHAEAADYAIQAPSAALATDLLRERVVNAARANHATVAGVAETQAAPGTVAVRADLALAPERIATFVAAIENGRPWAVVDQFGVVAEGGLQSGGTGTVTVRLDVSVRYDVGRAAR